MHESQASTTNGVGRNSRAAQSEAAPLVVATSQDQELQHALRLLQRSRAEALEQLQASQQRARRQEREQMHQLMGELRSWKQQNERRLRQLSSRASQPLAQMMNVMSPHSLAEFPEPDSPVATQLANERRTHSETSPTFSNPAANSPSHQPSLRELQRELKKLKSSLSVYLGT